MPEADMLIAIDGIDGSGKGTQTKLLFEYLSSLGKKVDLVSFPQYSSFFGTMVGEYLNGAFGTLEQVDPKVAALLFAMDRKDYFDKHELTGDIILCDRYVPSNIGHQAGRVSRGKRDAFVSWLEELEFNINGIPKPDLSILFDISVENSAFQVAKKQKRDYTDLTHDIHEQDRAYLTDVREYFLSLGEKDNYVLIDCEDGQGGVRPIEEIFDQVKDLVDSLLDS
jgi:dTMP kinase